MDISAPPEGGLSFNNTIDGFPGKIRPSAKFHPRRRAFNGFHQDLPEGLKRQCFRPAFVHTKTGRFPFGCGRAAFRPRRKRREL
jgi:hypothetical protein